MLSWSSQMFIWNVRPPNPYFVKNWKYLWRKRLESSRSWVVNWLSHQLRDDYWKHGSVCEDPARLQVPVLAIGEKISYTLQMYLARCRHNTVNFFPNTHNRYSKTLRSGCGMVLFIHHILRYLLQRHSTESCLSTLAVNMNYFSVKISR